MSVNKYKIFFWVIGASIIINHLKVRENLNLKSYFLSFLKKKIFKEIFENIKGYF
jgi:hypothetical protein